MTRVLCLAVLLSATYAGAAPFELLGSIGNPSPARGDFFGAAVALTGGTMVVGAPSDDGTALDAGAVYLYDASSGSLLRSLANPSPGAGDQFGYAVAMAGADVFVAAPHHDSGAAHAGAVYRFDASTGALQHTFPDPTPTQSDAFGFAIAAAGGRLLVGAPFKGSAGGAFLLDAGSGAVIHALAPSDPGTADAFGRAVAMTGNVLAVAAPLGDVNGQVNAGFVALFDAGSGALTHTLTSTRALSFEQFGVALAADGGRVLVGAPFDGTSGSNAGAAYLFDAANGTLLQTILSPAPSADARFGSAVALAGNVVLVGAPFDDATAVNGGAAYVFDAATGLLLATFDDPSPVAGDQFGTAVAVAGSTFVAGAWLADGAFRDVGAVHLFVDRGLPPTSTETTTTSTTTTSPTVSTSTTSTTTTTTTATDTTTTATAGTTTTTTATTLGASTTTVPTSLTTTTTPQELPPVTTTTLSPGAVPCGETLCDDGDPCTADACIAGACRAPSIVGFAGVTCRVTLIEDVLHTTTAFAGRGARLRKRLQGRMALVHRLVATAADADPRRAFRRLRRAERLLGAFVATARAAGDSGRLGEPIATSLANLATDAAVRILPLRLAVRR